MESRGKCPFDPTMRTASLMVGKCFSSPLRAIDILPISHGCLVLITQIRCLCIFWSRLSFEPEWKTSLKRLLETWILGFPDSSPVLSYGKTEIDFSGLKKLHLTFFRIYVSLFLECLRFHIRINLCLVHVQSSLSRFNMFKRNKSLCAKPPSRIFSAVVWQQQTCHLKIWGGFKKFFCLFCFWELFIKFREVFLQYVLTGVSYFLYLLKKCRFLLFLRFSRVL